jgi:geranylgeranyl diphosphate synthase type II
MVVSQHAHKKVSSIHDLAPVVDSWLSELAVDGSAQWVQAMRYGLLTPGKRFRPVCALLVGEILGLKHSDIKELAICLEILHTSTLIHDDLPALDNDSLRRGRPTLHVEFGEGVALLVGDALVGEVFSRLACSRLPCELIGLFASTYKTVCEGQVLDLDVNIDSWERVAERHQKKTASMIELALVAPTYLVSDLKPGLRADLSLFGKRLGLLFQLIDDIRDVTWETAALGKTSKLDAQLGRVTAVSFLGLEHARKMAAETAEQCRELAASGGFSELIQLVEYLEERM